MKRSHRSTYVTSKVGHAVVRRLKIAAADDWFVLRVLRKPEQDLV
jgi:hypothetical protein